MSSIELNTKSFVESCCNPFSRNDFMRAIELKNRKNYLQIFKFLEYEDDMVDNITYYDSNEKEKFKASYSEFINKLKKNLNIKSSTKNEKELDKAFSEKLNILKGMLTENEILEKMFSLCQEYASLNDNLFSIIKNEDKINEIINSKNKLVEEYIKEVKNNSNNLSDTSKIINEKKISFILQLNSSSSLQILKNKFKLLYERQLLEEFPEIYKKFQDSKNHIKHLKDEKKILDGELEDNKNNALIFKQIDLEIDDLNNKRDTYRKYIRRCGITSNYSKYIDKQITLYESFISNRSLLIKDTSFDNLVDLYLDKDKVYLYLMNEYLKRIASCDERNEIKNYINLVERYLCLVKNKDTSILVDNEVINLENINEKLKIIKWKFAHDVIILDWSLAHDGHDSKSIKSVNRKIARRIALSSEEIERLKSIGEERNDFYDNTNYSAKANGLEKNLGYTAYIYPNGKVILDKEYDEKRTSTAIGNAIYVLTAINFEALSKLDKANLRKHPDVQRIVHSANWQERVQRIIDIEPTEESLEDTKKLIKRLKK